MTEPDRAPTTTSERPGAEPDPAASGDNLSTSQTLLIGRLLMRLLPRAGGDRPEVSPEELASTPGLWRQSVALLALAIGLGQALVHLVPVTRHSEVSLLAGLLGVWLPYQPTLVVLTGAGLIYFLSGLLGITWRFRRPSRDDEVYPNCGRPMDEHGGGMRWWDWMVLPVTLPLALLAWALRELWRLVRHPRRSSAWAWGQWLRGWRLFSPRRPETAEKLRKYALLEERLFREGAEGWGRANRARACLVFGAIHFANLIYPIAVLVALTLVAGVLMAVYLRRLRGGRDRHAALVAAGSLHYTYNRIATVGLLLVGRATLVALPFLVLAQVVLLAWGGVSRGLRALS